MAQVLELEEEGKLNLTVRLKKRALQGAYDLALKKKKVRLKSLITLYVDLWATLGIGSTVNWCVGFSSKHLEVMESRYF